MPDDGHRYELVDGTLIVTPAPSPLHQRVLRRLTILLEERRPGHLELLFAPLDVALGDDTSSSRICWSRGRTSSPNGTCRRRRCWPSRSSPSTRRIDLTLKRARYEAADCPSYWVVDPDAPSLTAWELQDGRYVDVATVTGNERFHATSPFEVVVTPALLID